MIKASRKELKKNFKIFYIPPRLHVDDLFPELRDNYYTCSSAGWDASYRCIPFVPYVLIEYGYRNFIGQELPREVIFEIEKARLLNSDSRSFYCVVANIFESL